MLEYNFNQNPQNSQVNICPICGQPVSGGNSAGWQRIPGVSPFFAGNAATLSPGASWRRQTPARKPEVVSDVVVPGAQAAITGILAGIGGGLIAGDWIAGLTIGGLVTGGAWFWFLGGSQKTIWLVESITGADLNGDGLAGQPATPARQNIRIELAQDEPGSAHRRLIDLPIDDNKARAMATALLNNGASFSRRGLAGILSDTEYSQTQTALLAAGLLRQRGEAKNSGFDITGKGKAVLRQLAGGQ